MSQAFVDQLLHRAQSHYQARQFEQAALVFEQILGMQPDHGVAHARLGEIFIRAGQVANAERHLAAALEADPSLVTAANDLAILYRQSGRAQLACVLLREATAREPDYPEAWYNLGNALEDLQEYEAAIHAFETALRLRPNYHKALINMGEAHRLMLRDDLSQACLRRLAALNPPSWAVTNQLFYAMFTPEVKPAEVAALAESYDARFAAPLRATESVFDAAQYPRDPDRPLRIGYMGAIFFCQAVGLLAEPVLAGHDRSQFEVFCYSDVQSPDEVTERYRKLPLTYRETRPLFDTQLTDLIRQDRIDILVDMNLHMTKPRLLVIARRAAPVQINYLAYPFTCGVRTMDYRVTDAILDPPCETAFGSEALIRLRSSYWLYRGNPAAPQPPEKLPARASFWNFRPSSPALAKEDATPRQGPITFANFNYTQKLNPGVAAAWVSILNQVPGSRLMQLTVVPSAQRPHFERLFGEAGLDPTRIDLAPQIAHELNLARYSQVDLCLDPFPYGGHTSTLDSLWMGVPVLTLAGPAPYLRGAASILPRVGLGELVTHSVEEYKEKAVALAHDFDRLQALRHDLRGRMQASVLCDEAGWMADYERGLRLAWRRFCQGLAPADIDLSEPVSPDLPD